MGSAPVEITQAGLLGHASDPLLTDPLLGVLASNGVPTRTQLLLAGSPAIDAGDAAGCFFSDQRGHPRPLDGDENGSAVCDVGAVEVPEPEVGLEVLARPGGGHRGLDRPGRAKIQGDHRLEAVGRIDSPASCERDQGDVEFGADAIFEVIPACPDSRSKISSSFQGQHA